MKNLRTYLWAGLALILFLDYLTWSADFAPRDAAAAAAAQKVAETEKATHPLTAAVPQVPTAPAAANATSTAANEVPRTNAPIDASASAPVAAAAAPVAATLSVHTDVLDVDVSLQGGQLTRADLLQYPITKGGTEPVHLLRSHGAGDQFLLQTGLTGADSTAAPGGYPTHLALFTSDYTGFRLESGVDELRVPLKWTSPDGITVLKTLIFHRGSYRVDVEYELQNAGSVAWSVAPYAQIVHDMPTPKRTYFNVDSYSFTGPAYWDGSQHKYQKIKLTADGFAAFNRDYPDGRTDSWIASLQHHFVTAIVPAPTEPHHYTLYLQGTEFQATDVGPKVAVAPGASATIEQTLFIGPKLQNQLVAIHPELGRAADFGRLTLIARPLFWLMERAHSIFRNWGFAIIAVTFLLKLAMYPLSEISGRSAAKMKQIAPKMKQLQETYKDDRAKLGQATMELYKKEKINPAAGCLPMLVQIPVFMAFYWVLLESVEMRQAPFIGWIHDLSSRDPLYILPAIMACAMFLQYKIQPPSADPVQAKVFMIMPLVMSVTFAFFPAGLVLYWVTNTVLTILQQWNINRRIAALSTARN